MTPEHIKIIEQNRYLFIPLDKPDKHGFDNGVAGNKKLNKANHKELKSIATELYEDIGEPIQLEFVIHDNELYIVQLRVLENNYERTVIIQEPDNIIATGKTFSHGYTDYLDISDILIVDSDALTQTENANLSNSIIDSIIDKLNKAKSYLR